MLTVVQEEKNDILEENPTRTMLSRLVEESSSREEFLNGILREAALECDVLGDVGHNIGRNNPMRSQIASRRVQSLKFLSEMYFQKTKSSRQPIDLKSPEMQLILKSILSRFKDTLENLEDLPHGMTRKIFQEFNKQMEGWESDIKEQLDSIGQGEGVV